MGIIIIIVIIVIIVLVKSIRKNLNETKTKPYQQKSYQPSQPPPRSTQPIYRQPEKSEPISSKSSESYCKFCGEKTAKDAAFCPNCGSKL